MSTELAGKIALVTGASKGIGAGIAVQFGKAGARVAVGYVHDLAGAQRVVQEISHAGGQAIAVQGDVSRIDDVEAMLRQVTSTFGPLDVLVNNGAVFDFKGLQDIDEEHYRKIFDVNVLGTINVTKCAVANFGQAGGSIINISSLSAQGNSPYSAIYSASKASVNAITKVLALELAPKNIRVNAIMPGYYDTEGSRALGVKGSEQEAHLIATTPLAKRAGHPADLSPVAVFLASHGSSWMTGEILTVSCGLR